MSRFIRWLLGERQAAPMPETAHWDGAPEALEALAQLIRRGEVRAAFVLALVTESYEEIDYGSTRVWASPDVRPRQKEYLRALVTGWLRVERQGVADAEASVGVRGAAGDGAGSAPAP